MQYIKQVARAVSIKRQKKNKKQKNYPIDDKIPPISLSSPDSTRTVCPMYTYQLSSASYQC